MAPRVGRSGNRIPRQVSELGITLVALINFFVIGYLCFEALTVVTYRTSQPGSVSIVEAAYIGAQWSRLTFGAAVLAAFNILTVGIAISWRISRLQQAQLFAAAEVVAAVDRDGESTPAANNSRSEG